MKNKSSSIFFGAVILIFALIGLKNFSSDYISSERFEKSLQPVPFSLYEIAANFFTEENSAEDELAEGLKLYHQGKYQASIDFYTEYLKKNPESEVAYNRRGNVYFLKFKQYGAAIDDYNRAIEINSNYWKPYYNRGNVYALLGNYTAAIDDYNRAIELNPKFYGAYENRQLCYEKLRRI